MVKGIIFFKILFLISGHQYLHEIEISGGVDPEAQVIWDERVDGTIPVFDDYEILSRSEGKTPKLVVDAEKKKLKDARLVQEASDLAAKEQRKTDINAIKEKLKNGTELTPTETTKALKSVLMGD